MGAVRAVPRGTAGRQWSVRRGRKLRELRSHEKNEQQRVGMRRGALAGSYLVSRARADRLNVYDPGRFGVPLEAFASALRARVVSVFALMLAFKHDTVAICYRELGELLGCSYGTARLAVAEAVGAGFVEVVAMFERQPDGTHRQTPNVYKPGPALLALWETWEIRKACWSWTRRVAREAASDRGRRAALRRWKNQISSRQKYDFALSEQSSDPRARARELIRILTEPLTDGDEVGAQRKRRAAEEFCTLPAPSGLEGARLRQWDWLRSSASRLVSPPPWMKHRPAMANEERGGIATGDVRDVTSGPTLSDSEGARVETAPPPIAAPSGSDSFDLATNACRSILSLLGE